MKNLLKKILLEYTVNTDYLEKLEIKVLKNLNKAGFTKTTPRNKIIIYLNDMLGFDFEESMDFYLLFRNNFLPSGEYETLTNVKRDVTSSSKIKSSNKTARDLVNAKIPFKGSNTSGEWVDKNTYVVKSYDWYPIFVYKDGVWYENDTRYSPTTSKQKGQLRPNSETIKISRYEMENLID